jgi:hypothetical protein
MKKFLLSTLVLVAFALAMNATTKTSIKTSDLPKAASEDISKNYSSFSIKEAFRIENKGITQFEVILQKANEKLVLSYEKDGKFIKKSVVPSISKMELTKPENKAAPKKGIK